MARANQRTFAAQRGLLDRNALAAEFSQAEIRQPQRPNGVTNPQDEDYRALAANNFVDYRLKISGLVDRPLSLSLEELHQMPTRRQITRHDCVEGWSCNTEWIGVPLSKVMDAGGVRPNARYALFR